ncbi:MAG TPA: class I SAM-dependent methyltransferase [Actinocatenispora sp.]
MSTSRPTAAEVEAARDDPKQANILYHDWEADTYDEKWSISYDERCVNYARDRFAHVAGTDGWPYRNALELGCGTGFFLLNLMQAGVIEQGFVTDISPGMVEVALRNARQLDLDVSGQVSDAETIAYDDATFDLVVGHAMLHHIPDVEKALREVLRVLRPGGRFVFCGEPTKVGDWYARKLGQATWWATTNLTKLPGLTGWRRPQQELDESSAAAALEAVVDIHTFDPGSLRRTAEAAGAIDVEVATDELTAAFLGWPVRTFEAAVPADKLGWGWARFAFNSWRALSAVDEKLLSRVVPKEFFYNVEITGVKP